jgi:toxin ParE1/3/4
MSFVVSPRAEADLKEIIDYISADSPKAAARVLSDIEAAMELLDLFPLMGHPRADVPASEYRFWTVFNYIIVYRAHRDDVTIVRVVHGHRDIPQVLAESGE